MLAVPGSGARRGPGRSPGAGGGRLNPPSGDPLAAHLEATYGVRVHVTAELDRDVHRVDMVGGERWVARLRPAEAAARDVAVLGFLAGTDIPAEQLVTEDPLSHLDGRSVVVTRFVAGVRGDARREVVRREGGLAAMGGVVAKLGLLGSDPVAPTHAGGAWHHLADGVPADEVAAATTILDGAEDPPDPGDRAALAALREAIDDVDAGDGLPTGLVHPDPVLANVVASPDHGMVFVDWAGAGRGPVLWSLAWLLWAEAAKDIRRAGRVLAGYRRHAGIAPDELDRLPAMARARATTIAVGAWHVAGLPIDKAAARARRSAEIASQLRSLC